jgi:hypothetical protein
MAIAIAAVHKNQHLQGMSLIFGIAATIATVYYLIHQTKHLKLQIDKHDKETQLLDLQIAKHESDLKENEPSKKLLTEK